LEHWPEDGDLLSYHEELRRRQSEMEEWQSQGGIREALCRTVWPSDLGNREAIR